MFVLLVLVSLVVVFLVVWWVVLCRCMLLWVFVFVWRWWRLLSIRWFLLVKRFLVFGLFLWIFIVVKVLEVLIRVLMLLWFVRWLIGVFVLVWVVLLSRVLGILLVRRRVRSWVLWRRLLFWCWVVVCWFGISLLRLFVLRCRVRRKILIVLRRWWLGIFLSIFMRWMGLRVCIVVWCFVLGWVFGRWFVWLLWVICEFFFLFLVFFIWLVVNYVWLNRVKMYVEKLIGEVVIVKY